ncbi:MAG: class I SAM-dependent methyltransferase [Hyphomicrobiales bacterium]|nr:class I SAM-dependent methyltransferase [Hyphomicrobiales bacterium]
MSIAAYWNGVYQASDYSVVVEGTVLSRAVAFFGDLSGRSLLDLGCGRGGSSLYFAARGAEVTALDISDYAIADLKQTCSRERLKNVHPVQHDALRIDELGGFDFVFGSMILHHIEPFAQFAASLRRCLKPTGKAFFYENNASSRMLVWFRKNVVGKLWIPKYGDPDEFPLTADEVDTLKKSFEVSLEYPEMLFFRLASTYLLRGRLEAPFAAADDFCFRHKLLLRHSYRQYVLLNAASPA